MLEAAGDTVYLGGEFDSLIPHTGSGAMLDPATGTIIANKKALYVNGRTHAAAPDGSGGWYIGGDFTKVGNTYRHGAARIRVDGTLHPFDPVPNGIVRAFAVSRGRVNAGGDFTSICGQSRNMIALLYASSGSALSWNPGANAEVRSIAVAGGTVYVGGSFTLIGGQSRNRIASFDDATGSITGWDPGADTIVNAIAVAGGTVYAGGGFASIGGIISLRSTPRPALCSTGNRSRTSRCFAWRPEVAQCTPEASSPRSGLRTDSAPRRST